MADNKTTSRDTFQQDAAAPDLALHKRLDALKSAVAPSAKDAIAIAEEALQLASSRNSISNKVEQQNAALIDRHVQDLLDRKDLLDRIQKAEAASTIDKTGIYNENGANLALPDMVGQARRDKQWVALFRLDGDHFKQVNDTRGHDEGDKVLGLVAHAMKHSMQKIDLVARYGGDEFLAACAVNKATGFENASNIAKRLCQTIEKDCMEYGVTASLGFTLLDPTNLTDPQIPDAITVAKKRADDALYVSKNTGRNRAWYLPFNESGDDEGPARQQVWPKNGIIVEAVPVPAPPESRRAPKRTAGSPKGP